MARSAKTRPLVAAMLARMRAASTRSASMTSLIADKSRSGGLHDRHDRGRFGVPVAEATLVLLGACRSRMPRRDPGLAWPPPAPPRNRPGCACAASSTIRRRAPTLRRPRTASAAPRRERSYPARRRRRRTRPRARPDDRDANATAPRGAAGPVRVTDSRPPADRACRARPASRRATELQDARLAERLGHARAGPSDGAIPAGHFQPERDRWRRLHQRPRQHHGTGMRVREPPQAGGQPCVIG